MYVSYTRHWARARTPRQGGGSVPVKRVVWQFRKNCKVMVSK